MANPVNAHGFRPLMTSLSGSPCRIAEYAKPASDSHVIGMWDIVTKVAATVASPTGYSALLVRTVKTFGQATPGTTLLLGSSLNWGAASKLTYHYVVDTPDAIFEAMFGIAVAFTNAVDGGLNANVKNTECTALSNISAMYVDDSTVLSTATLDVKLINLYNVPPNTDALNAIVEVVINKHQLGQGTLGV